MELFTNTIASQKLKVILTSQLKVKDVEFKTFKDTPQMTWLGFSFDNIRFNLIHHHVSEKYSFKGSLLNLQLDSMAGVSFKAEVHQETFTKIMKCLLMSLGGLLSENGSDEYLEGCDSPGTQNSNFLLQELFLHGVDDESIGEVLETMLNKAQAKSNSNC